MIDRKAASWYFDVVSPFAYLVLKQIGSIRQRLDVTPVPIVLGAVLAHNGQKGPAEIAAKRLHTYRMSQWRAGELGVPFRFPPAHPFNPIAALRLLVALDADWHAIEQVFQAIWSDHRDLADAGEVERLGRSLGLADPAAAIATPEVKDRLRANTDQAIARGVFGVPTFAVDDELFWGEDALPLLHAYLDDPDLFRTGEMARLPVIPVGIVRR